MIELKDDMMEILCFMFKFCWKPSNRRESLWKPRRGFNSSNWRCMDMEKSIHVSLKYKLSSLSPSQIINNSRGENKTKEITALKEVWKCDLNYYKIWWILLLILLILLFIIDGLRSYIKNSKECFIWFPNTLKTGSLLISVFGNWMKHPCLCLIWYF